MSQAKNMTDALDSLMRDIIDGATNGNSMPPPKERGAKPPAKSSGVDAVPEKQPAKGGGGIASPLTEISYASREFHPPTASHTSSDGLMIWEISAIKKTSFTDADGNTVVINWAAPA